MRGPQDARTTSSSSTPSEVCSRAPDAAQCTCEPLARRHISRCAGWTQGTAGTYDLRRRDLRLMKDGEWLNDNCINMYMAMMAKRELLTGGCADIMQGPLPAVPATHFFSAFLYSKLRQGRLDPADVERSVPAADAAPTYAALMHITCAFPRQVDRRQEVWIRHLALRPPGHANQPGALCSLAAA